MKKPTNPIDRWVSDYGLAMIVAVALLALLYYGLSDTKGSREERESRERIQQIKDDLNRDIGGR